MAFDKMREKRSSIFCLSGSSDTMVGYVARKWAAIRSERVTQNCLDQSAALPTRGMLVSCFFFVSLSTLKVEPHIWPWLSTRGTALISCSGCSKLCSPPEVV
jgi:hypothetical protein